MLVITGLGVGGAERIVSDLADGLSAVGHEVVLVYFRGPASIRPTDSRIKLVDLYMAKDPVSLFRSLLRFRNLIRRWNPDVINSHLVHANILTRLLRLLTPMKRLVSSAHNTNEGGRLRMLAYRLTDSLADVSTNVSRAAVKAFVARKASCRGRMAAITNGIDTTAFVFNPSARVRLRREFAADGEEPVLLAVGRLCEEKDYPNLLYSLYLLKKMGATPTLLIVGGGKLEGELTELSESLALHSQVKFLGIRHDIVDLMSACDVFVLSSMAEGFGLVVAEAMACQRVVVATDSGGVREVLGEAGFLVPPRDRTALAEALRSALSVTGEARTELGQRARERVMQFYSMDTTTEQYLAVYSGEHDKRSVAS